MDSLTSKFSSTKGGHSLAQHAMLSPTDEGSIEKQAVPGKPSHVSEETLEEAPPKPKESKVLEGRWLFFSFVAMLLSLLLIALGWFSIC